MSSKVNQQCDVAMIEDDGSRNKRNVKWYYPNPQMTTSKLTYFFQNAKQSCYTPHMLLFLTSVGLTTSQAGFINGIRYVGYLGAPFFSILADRTSSHRCIIFFICIMALLLNCSQPFVTLPLASKEMNQCPLLATARNMSIPLQTNLTGTAKLGNSSNHHDTKDNKSLFFVLLFLNVFIVFFDGSTLPFADSGVMQKINQYKMKCEFGRQRLFGAFGFGCGVLISSLAIDLFPNTKVTCYSAIFIIYFLIMAALAITTNRLFKGLHFSKKTEKRTVKLLWKSLKQFQVIIFLLTTLIVGIIRGTNVSFLFLFLRQLEASNVLMALIYAIGSMSSVVMFFYSSWVMERCGGTLQAMCLSALVWVFRFFCYLFCTATWQIAILQSLHGICFGVFISAGIQHIKLISPSPVWTSMTGIFNGLYFGAGMIIANIFGGVIYDKYGVRRLFLIICLQCFVWCILLLIFIFLKSCKSSVQEFSEVELVSEVILPSPIDQND